MIVECSKESVELAEPFDFRRFKLILKGDADIQGHVWQGIRLVDERNALVSIDLVPALRGCPDDASWAPAFAEMIAKAREHGWVDSAAHAIRAHVERQP